MVILDSMLDAKEWNYKAEGNKHIVFCNYQGKVLRLKKLTVVCECNGVICQKCKGSANNDELKYQQFVIMPLMNFSTACLRPFKIQLPGSFIDQLNEKVQMDRPAYRRHKSLLRTKFGILMEDKTLLHLQDDIKNILANNSHSDVFSVEIKLKKGFMSEHDPAFKDQVCQFCALQLYRCLFGENKRSKLSYYCPIDLFSGCRTAMKEALRALVESPQNTFRVFKNGNAVYSQELLDILLSSDKTRTGHALLSQLIRSFFSKTLELRQPTEFSNGSQKLPFTCCLDMLLDLLCSALLTPLDKNQSSNIYSNRSECKGKVFKSTHLKKPAFSSEKRFSEKTVAFGKEDNVIPSSSILGQVLSCQRISNVGNCCLRKAYTDIFHCNDNSAISELDGPYDKTSWQTIGKIDMGSHQKEVNVLKNGESRRASKNRHLESAVKQQQLVQKYLVSKSFCDCSVMITMKNVTGHHNVLEKYLENMDTTNNNNSMQLIKSGDDSYFLISISVVDIDPKPSSRVPLYCQQYEKLQSWWTSKLNNHSS